MFDFSWQAVLTEINNTLLNPQKRIFFGYLLSAVLIAMLWSILVKRDSLSKSINNFFSFKIWWSTSSQSDYKIFLINKIILILLSPILIGRLLIATSLFYALHDIFPSRPMFFTDSPGWLISALFTLTYFLFDDFARFYIHRLMHSWPVLWAFHKVHHSAETMTPMTVFRTHPLEVVLFSLRSTIVQAISISMFVFFMGERADLLTVFGANIFLFSFNILGSNLRHSHTPISYPNGLEKYFISPAQHQIHHSTAMQHRDKNFGVILSVWDRLFNSLHHSETKQSLEFGLEPKSSKNHAAINKTHNLKTLYFVPFQDALKVIKKSFIKKKLFFSKNKSTLNT